MNWFEDKIYRITAAYRKAHDLPEIESLKPRCWNCDTPSSRLVTFVDGHKYCHICLSGLDDKFSGDRYNT
jgi:hypothetical protein